MIIAAVGPKFMFFLIFISVLCLILVILLIKYLKLHSFKATISLYMTYVYSGSLLEKKYIEHIFKLESGKRSREQIKLDFRKSVGTENNSIRNIEFPDEKIYNEMRKTLNKL